MARENSERQDTEGKEAGLENVTQLQIGHLKFAYPDGKQILNDISFQIKKGQMIGITGPVACGKSTLG